MYSRFIGDRGYEVELNATGGIKANRKTGQSFACQPICSWFTFRKFWKEVFPLLRIIVSSLFLNVFHHVLYHTYLVYFILFCFCPLFIIIPIIIIIFIIRVPKTIYDLPVVFFTTGFDMPPAKKNKEPGKLADHAGEGIDKYYTTKDIDRRGLEVEQELRKACIDLKKDIYATVVFEEDDAVKERNKSILEAAEHVKEAQGMREEGNKQIAEALEDQRNELPHDEARQCIIGDFCQNCGIPYLGACQAGDTNYFSPLNINVFGVVDCGVQGGALHAYPYQKGMGRKGGAM
jgi:hypothetical protein